ncbi:MAG: hypothetical protein HYX76_15100, partial [Acidobacteria bacterium]|nr:hypothetical protein [Acidobacteriota bacterium]
MSLVSGMRGNRRVPQDAAHLDLLSLVRQIIRRQRTLQDRVSAAEEEGDCLALDLEELRRRLERAAPIDRSPLP